MDKSGSENPVVREDQEEVLLEAEAAHKDDQRRDQPPTSPSTSQYHSV